MKLTVRDVADLLHIDVLTVRYLLDYKEVDWGISIKKRGSKRTQYIIFPEKFTEATGIEIPSFPGDM